MKHSYSECGPNRVLMLKEKWSTQANQWPERECLTLVTEFIPPTNKQLKDHCLRSVVHTEYLTRLYIKNIYLLWSRIGMLKLLPCLPEVDLGCVHSWTERESYTVCALFELFESKYPIRSRVPTLPHWEANVSIGFGVCKTYHKKQEESSKRS